MRVFNSSARPFVVATPTGAVVIPARTVGEVPEGTPNTPELAEAFRRRILVRRETSDSAVRDVPPPAVPEAAVLEAPQAAPADPTPADPTPEITPPLETIPEVAVEGDTPASRRKRAATRS